MCVLWGLMSCQYFFGFGHHATVTSLRFEAGFVGLHGEVHAYNLPFAAALVSLNTLGSQVTSVIITSVIITVINSAELKT